MFRNDFNKLNKNFNKNLTYFLKKGPKKFKLFLFDIPEGLNFPIYNYPCLQDRAMIRIYQSNYKSEACYANFTNTTKVDECLPNDVQEQCYSYPTIRILLVGIVTFEALKLLMGFLRIFKKYRKKITQVDERNMEATAKTSNFFLDRNESSVARNSLGIKPLSVAHLENEMELSSRNETLDVSDSLNLPLRKNDLRKVLVEECNTSDTTKIIQMNRTRVEISHPIATIFENAEEGHEDLIPFNSVQTTQNLKTTKMSIDEVVDFNKTDNASTNNAIIPKKKIIKTESISVDNKESVNSSDKIETVSNRINCERKFLEIDHHDIKQESKHQLNLDTKHEPKEETNENYDEVKTSMEDKNENVLPTKEIVKTTLGKKTTNYNNVYLKSVQDIFITLVAKKSLWNLISYIVLFLLIFSSSRGLAEVIMGLFRLEVYFVPVFWTLTDHKVMLFFMKIFKRCFRIYQFSS